MSAIALNKSDSIVPDLRELMDKIFCLVDDKSAIHVIDCVILTDPLEIIKKMDELLGEMREISANVKDLSAMVGICDLHTYSRRPHQTRGCLLQ